VEAAAAGRLIGLGTSPFRMIGLRMAPGSGTGTADSSALVWEFCRLLQQRQHPTKRMLSRVRFLHRPHLSGAGAAAGVGAAVVDPFSPRQSGGQELIVRPFTPKTVAVANMLWSEAELLSRLAKAFLNQVRQASHSLNRDAS
jgi:hypothetical protein